MTKIERKILANQFMILQKIDPSNAEHYKSNIEIISKGYTLEYGNVLCDMYDELSEAECEYVQAVLELHSNLKRSFEELEDKQGLTIADVEFDGFDGNNEIDRHSYAKYLVRDGSRWTDVNGGLNSHSIHTAAKYPEMLRKAEAIEQQHGIAHMCKLSADDIKAIITWK